MILKHDKPIYLEICSYFIQQIELGLFNEGDAMPSIRELAYELGINPNTVSRSYQILEAQGYIEIIAQKGAFVKKKSVTINKKAIKEVIKPITHQLTKEELIVIINEIYQGEEHD